MKFRVLLGIAGVVVLSGCVATGSGVLSAQDKTLVAFSKAETYPLTEPKFGPQSVPVEVFLPTKGRAPYPLIIHQHGSSRDGFSFTGGIGHTDEHGTRLRIAALEKGYAFAVLDAFKGKGLSPSDKGEFPRAEQYAKQLRTQLLAKYPTLDASNTFYTGFSYGGDAVMGQLYPPKDGGWKALVAAEPSCNVTAEPSALPYPLLIIKGTQSHYYPIACKLVVERHHKIGNPVSLSLLEGGNHYFSLNGEIVQGLAFNGCSENPIFVTSFWNLRRYDGSVFHREDIPKCFKREGGSGKGRELLDDAIAQTIAFFDKYKASER
jgi:hypothetical protein